MSKTAGLRYEDRHMAISGFLRGKGRDAISAREQSSAEKIMVRSVSE